MQKIKIRLVRSIIGRSLKQKLCIKGLGLTPKIGSTSIVLDTPENKGMINKVSFLLHKEPNE